VVELEVRPLYRAIQVVTVETLEVSATLAPALVVEQLLSFRLAQRGLLPVVPVVVAAPQTPKPRLMVRLLTLQTAPQPTVQPVGSLAPALMAVAVAAVAAATTAAKQALFLKRATNGSDLAVTEAAT